MMDLYGRILQKFKFSDAEMADIRLKYESFLQELKKRLGKRAEVMLGGSAAKGTIIKGDFDVDIFIRFRKGTKDLSDRLEKALEGLPYTRIHGSRDYFQLELDGIDYELIPVIKVDEPGMAENVTDMSPLHVAWIRKRIEKNPKIVDSIILAKAFCKAQGVYGAESYINGFSGHVIDVLIAYYGSFSSLVTNAVSWNRYKVIDIEGHGTEIDESKISPLIVIDPVQKNRNAAAALNLEKFDLFRQKAQAFVDRPSESFFRQKIMSRREIEKMIAREHKGRPYVMVSAEPLQASKDIAGTKLLKAFTFIRSQLAFYDFDILSSGWHWDKKGPALFWFVLMSSELAPEKEHMGPPLVQKKDVALFKKKHQKNYEKGKRVYATVRRKYTDIRSLLDCLGKCEYVRQRTGGVKIES